MHKIRNDVIYTIKALTYLHEYQQFKNIRAVEISKAEDIPINFLYTILRKLKDHDYIEITPGVRGGYKLKGNIKDATLLDIVIAISGDIIINNCCIKNQKCKRYNSCKIKKEFEIVEKVLKMSLSNKKIIDLF